MSALRAAVGCAAVLLAAGCSVGNGEGSLGGTMFLPECGYGAGGDAAGTAVPFGVTVRDLFGDVVDDRIDIRLQNNGAGMHVSDGLIVTVRNRHDVVTAIRGGGSVVLQVVAEWPLLPIAGPDLVARASLYLNSNCAESYVDFTRGVGSIEFTSMYARTDDGDYTDLDRIRGSFAGLSFRDERPEVAVDGQAPWALIDGSFDFDYTRGRPAQPFP